LYSLELFIKELRLDPVPEINTQVFILFTI